MISDAGLGVQVYSTNIYKASSYSENLFLIMKAMGDRFGNWWKFTIMFRDFLIHQKHGGPVCQQVLVIDRGVNYIQQYATITQ